jgi:hypothetical protein
MTTTRKVLNFPFSACGSRSFANLLVVDYSLVFLCFRFR